MIDSKLPQQYHFIMAWMVTIVVVAQQLETLRPINRIKDAEGKCAACVKPEDLVFFS